MKDEREDLLAVLRPLERGRLAVLKMHCAGTHSLSDAEARRIAAEADQTADLICLIETVDDASELPSDIWEQVSALTPQRAGLTA
jgi:hypothetical protein